MIFDETKLLLCLDGRNDKNLVREDVKTDVFNYETSIITSSPIENGMETNLQSRQLKRKLSAGFQNCAKKVNLESSTNDNQ